MFDDLEVRAWCGRGWRVPTQRYYIRYIHYYIFIILNRNYISFIILIFYPAETSSTQNRGKNTAAVFSMQGVGSMLATVV